MCLLMWHNVTPPLWEPLVQLWLNSSSTVCKLFLSSLWTEGVTALRKDAGSRLGSSWTVPSSRTCTSHLLLAFQPHELWLCLDHSILGFGWLFVVFCAQTPPFYVLSLLNLSPRYVCTPDPCLSWVTGGYLSPKCPSAYARWFLTFPWSLLCLRVFCDLCLLESPSGKAVLILLSDHLACLWSVWGLLLKNYDIIVPFGV